MKPTLVLRAGQVFLWNREPPSPSADKDGALSDAEVLHRCGASSVGMVLHDPYFLSACESIEIKSWRERALFARARCSELAGSGGFARWCVIPQGSSYRLFVLALDPNSADCLRLKELCAQGLSIASLTSRQMLERHQQSARSSGLRIAVDERSVQIALAEHGQWVFARRVDLKDATVAEAIISTLGYLKSQEYVELPLLGTWQLQAKNPESLAISDLWKGDEPLLVAPQVQPVSGQSTASIEAASSLICLRREEGDLLSRHGRSLLWVIRGVSLVLIGVLLPFMFLASSEIPIAMPPAADALPDKLQQRHWVMQELQALSLNEANEVVGLLMSILKVTDETESVVVHGFSVTMDQVMRLPCSLSQRLEDPLLRQRFFNGLQVAISTSIPAVRVQVLAADQYTVGESNSTSGFEIVVEKDDDSE